MILYSSVQRSYRELQINVIAGMRKDDVLLVLKNDLLILKFGSYNFESKGLPHKNYIAAKMRNLGRLLIQIRKDTGIDRSLNDFVDSKYFDAVLEAAKTVCGYGMNEDSENTPSLSLKLGHALKKCALLNRGGGGGGVPGF